MILADITLPLGHAAWIENLNYFLTFITTIGVLYLLFSNKPQKREISFQPESVTKEAFAQHAAENERALNNFDKQLEELKRDRKRDASDLHEKINDVGLQVAALDGKYDLTYQRLVQIDTKLDRTIERSKRNES